MSLPKYSPNSCGGRFYWLPKRLTLKCNPAVYRWGWWNWMSDVEAKKEMKERRREAECRADRLITLSQQIRINKEHDPC